MSVRFDSFSNDFFFSHLSYSDNFEIQTSYGSNSGVEYFESINYPVNYNDRLRVLYLLFIPGATSITFTFDSPFAIEENKDELYIGRGLEFDYNTAINGATDAANDKYFFEGRTVPNSFTINSDAVWMYFLTDKNNNDMTYAGFRVRWQGTLPDTTPPVISGCPANIVRTIALGQAGSSTSWTEPTATDDSGIVTLSSRSHQPGFLFSTGSTQVTYIFADGAGNTAICTFSVTVVTGKICMPFYILPEKKLSCGSYPRNWKMHSKQLHCNHTEKLCRRVVSSKNASAG